MNANPDVSKLPKISGYGDYSSKNYGVNSLRVSFERLTLYYSYETIVAVDSPLGLFVSENNWGVTTGKHLNWINRNKKDRLPYDKFVKKVEEALVHFGLIQ